MQVNKIEGRPGITGFQNIGYYDPSVLAELHN